MYAYTHQSLSRQFITQHESSDSSSISLSDADEDDEDDDDDDDKPTMSFPVSVV